MTENKISLYIHIPFCVRKCSYCDFLSFPIGECSGENILLSKYTEALCAEISTEAEHYQHKTVDTIFFGGGTPSVLPISMTEQLMEKIVKHYHISSGAEITLEMNPGTAKEEKIRAYRHMGFNRLSIGLQSSKDEELKMLGRIHTWQQFLSCYESARKTGFSNVNIDVMSALPGQSLPTYENTLQRVCALSPEHISAYSLIVEEGTPFFLQYQDGKGLPSEEEERQMYVATQEILKDHGYHRYEISNYAKEGRQCRHNSAYWKRADYAGFGLGAASLVDNTRWSNLRDIKEYVNGKEKKENIEILSQKEQMEEFMFLGLRMTEGVDTADFAKQFAVSMDNIYGAELCKLEREGLLQRKERVRLTPFGVDVSNYVLSRFLLEE